MSVVYNLGSLNLDQIYQVPHHVESGETLSATAFRVGAGGKGCNQSIACALAGAKVFHAGCIGKDGLMLKELLEKSGADTSFLEVLDEPTGRAVVMVNSEGNNSIVLFGGANQMVSSSLIERLVSSASFGDILLLQNETNMLAEAMSAAKEKGMKIVFNFAPFDGKKAETLPLELVDYLIVNEIEGAGLAGVQNPQKILEVLCAKYPETKILLTLGADGVVWTGPLGRGELPAFPAEVVDTTAAGDTFIGYFLAGIIENMSIGEAATLASKASAICCSRPGAGTAIPARREIC